MDPFPRDYATEYSHGFQVINDPYPDYEGEEWVSKSKGSYQACIGPHGRVLSRTDEDLMMSGYARNSSSTIHTPRFEKVLTLDSDFPNPIFGSYESWNLNQSLCTDRYSRYGAYGLLQGNENSQSHVWNDSFGSNHAAEIDWEMVNWSNLQEDCVQRNSIRYRMTENPGRKALALYKHLDLDSYDSPKSMNGTGPITQPRTAVLLRTWLGMKYTENDLYHIRSMVMELSLYSGGEHEVILLIDCQEEGLPAEDDPEAWKLFRKEHLPQELWGLAMFFNKSMLEDWYPDIDVHVYVSMAMNIQIYLADMHCQGDIAVLPTDSDFCAATPRVRLRLAV